MFYFFVFVLFFNLKRFFSPKKEINRIEKKIYIKKKKTVSENLEHSLKTQQIVVVKKIKPNFLSPHAFFKGKNILLHEPVCGVFFGYIWRGGAGEREVVENKRKIQKKNNKKREKKKQNQQKQIETNKKHFYFFLNKHKYILDVIFICTVKMARVKKSSSIGGG